MADGAAAGLGTRVRMVATDLDGTLLFDKGVVSARTVDAVRAARRVGIHVVPATARPPHVVWELASACGLGPLGVCCNGSAVIDLDHLVTLEVHRLVGDDAIAIVTAVRAALDGVRFAADDFEHFIHEPGFFEMSPDWAYEIDQVDDVRCDLERGTIQLVIRRPGCSAAELVTQLDAVLGDRSAVTISSFDWVQLAPPLVSKAAGLAGICARVGVEPSQVIAVGDNHNDLRMLAWAGTAMAVANAEPGVLAIADRLLPSTEDHGVAVLLEELVDTYS